MLQKKTVWVKAALWGLESEGLSIPWTWAVFCNTHEVKAKPQKMQYGHSSCSCIHVPYQAVIWVTTTWGIKSSFPSMPLKIQSSPRLPPSPVTWAVLFVGALGSTSSDCSYCTVPHQKAIYTQRTALCFKVYVSWLVWSIAWHSLDTAWLPSILYDYRHR